MNKTGNRKLSSLATLSLHIGILEDTDVIMIIMVNSDRRILIWKIWYSVEDKNDYGSFQKSAGLRIISQTIFMMHRPKNAIDDLEKWNLTPQYGFS